MRNLLAIAVLVLAGCSTPPPAKPSVVLPAGTKIISPVFSEIRTTFKERTDYWRAGSVVEISEPMLLTAP